MGLAKAAASLSGHESGHLQNSAGQQVKLSFHLLHIHMLMESGVYANMQTQVWVSFCVFMFLLWSSQVFLFLSSLFIKIKALLHRGMCCISSVFTCTKRGVHLGLLRQVSLHPQIPFWLNSGISFSHLGWLSCSSSEVQTSSVFNGQGLLWLSQWRMSCGKNSLENDTGVL